MANYFIDRPVFAWVLAIIMMLAGGLAIMNLPVAQYPQIAPPTITVSATYPGADAQTVEDSVTQVIEQNMNGLDGLMYMSSTSDAAGNASITLTFETGTSPDIAQVQVQNKLQLAMPSLPEAVQQQGISVDKSSSNILMVAAFISDNGSLNQYDIADYVASNIKDPLSRTAGVGSVQLFGSEYAMRIWLDPQKLNKYNLVPSDVISQIKVQNNQISGGQLGGMPQAADQQLNASIIVQTRLQTPEEFGKILLKVQQDGSQVLLRDVARVELGAEDYSTVARYNGKPAAGIAIKLATGANALDTSRAVKEELNRLSAYFPASLKTVYPYDTTPFIEISIQEVFKTLVEAIILVFLVMYLFLQNFRATIIPTIAVPVVILGTFAILSAVGFTINTLTMFGMVLAIGLLVDDAIVVVENVERHIALGESPKDAARKAMDEVTGPILAITSVLAAVFIPSAFLSGLQGEFYRQFALTIAFSTILSAINSLTLSPALAAILLKPHHGAAKPDRVTRIIDGVFGGFFRRFNRFFDRASNSYVGGVRRAVRGSAIVLLLYVGFLGLTWLGFHKVPAGFVPAQDKYYLVGIAQLPTGASLDRTEAVVKEMTKIALAEPGVESVVAFPGLSVNGPVNQPNTALMFAMLKPFDERKDPSLSAFAIQGKLMGKFSQIPDGFVGIFPPPPVPGLGSMGGFKLQIEDRAGLGPEALAQAQGQIMGKAMQAPELANMLASFQTNAPQLQVDIDRVKAKSQGVSLTEVFDTLQVNLGSLYVNDFNRFGRTYRVMAQADAQFRMQAEDIGMLKVRNAAGDMIPLSAFATIERSSGPDRVMHYNGFPSADISGGPAPGYSSGQATAAIEKIVSESLPDGMTYEWTDLTFQEKRVGNTAIYIFALAVLLAFLFLAAQYNSWSLPFAVLLIAPMALLSAIAGVWLSGGDNNIFTQIGFVVLIGLAAKNAILIVEFARAKESEGADPLAAVLEAARLRLRPILMTSFAFIAGVVPLVLASGAGAEMRHAMGIAVFAGMLGVTVFGLVLTPVFYVVVRKLALRREARHARVGMTDQHA